MTSKFKAISLETTKPSKATTASFDLAHPKSDDTLKGVTDEEILERV